MTNLKILSLAAALGALLLPAAASGADLPPTHALLAYAAPIDSAFLAPVISTGKQAGTLDISRKQPVAKLADAPAVQQATLAETPRDPKEPICQVGRGGRRAHSVYHENMSYKACYDQLYPSPKLAAKLVDVAAKPAEPAFKPVRMASANPNDVPMVSPSVTRWEAAEIPVASRFPRAKAQAAAHDWNVTPPEPTLASVVASPPPVPSRPAAFGGFNVGVSDHNQLALGVVSGLGFELDRTNAAIVRVGLDTKWQPQSGKIRPGADLLAGIGTDLGGVGAYALAGGRIETGSGGTSYGPKGVLGLSFGKVTAEYAGSYLNQPDWAGGGRWNNDIRLGIGWSWDSRSWN